MEMILVGVTTELKPNWLDLVPGPKMGNLKDPEKIAAKEAEWQAHASTNALKRRLTSDIADFQVVDATGAIIAGGEGPEALLAAVVNNSEEHTKVIGFDIRRRLSQAAIATWASSGAYIPNTLWNFQVSSSVESKVFDPISILLRYEDTKEELLATFGIEGIYTATPAEQCAALAELTKTMFGD